MPEYPVTVQMHESLKKQVAELAATVAQLSGVVNSLLDRVKEPATPAPNPKNQETVKLKSPWLEHL